MGFKKNFNDKFKGVVTPSILYLQSSSNTLSSVLKQLVILFSFFKTQNHFLEVFFRKLENLHFTRS